MPRVLNDNVWVDGRMYAVGTTPEDPAVVGRIGDHCWRELALSTPIIGPDPEPEQSFAVEEVGPSVFAAADPEPEPEASPDPVSVAGSEPPAIVPVPPKGGPGSGKSAWAEYARAHNVSVEAGSSREDIIDQLDDAGVPTE